MVKMNFSNYPYFKNIGKELEIVSFCEENSLNNAFICNNAEEADLLAASLNNSDKSKDGSFKHFTIKIKHGGFDIIREF